MSFITYGTHADQLSIKYPLITWPFSSSEDIRTQLPKNIAIIRAVAAIAFTALIAFKVSSTIFFWPVALLGAALAAKTLYSHLYVKDPLVEAFYTIAGGKESFEELPRIHLQLKPDEKICDAIRRLDWEKLERISRAATLDGRNIVIIKVFYNYSASYQNKKIFAFIEKVGPNDIPRGIVNLSELTESIMHAVLAPLTGNTFARWLDFTGSYSWGIHSFISSDMANEFFAQLNTRDTVN